ncbi:MAG TPA: nucleotide-binding protein [Thermoplasmata archaeon]|nr:nucleotide-binding protein [Thermoplasmata archaeon]
MAPPPPVAPPVPPSRLCTNCKVAMAPAGQIAIRTTGYVGPVGWAAPAEGVQPFSLYFCRQCGRYDLYYPGS